MSAIEFLDMLAKEFKQNHLHISANLLRFALNYLSLGDIDGALLSVRDSKEFLVGEMHKGVCETDRYSRDLVLLNTVEKMLLQEAVNG